MKTVLVTGGAGFIGSHLVSRLLDEGMTVRILDNLSPQIHGQFPQSPDWLNHPHLEFVRGSLTGEIDWDRLLGDVTEVVHLAAETGTGQSMYEIARYNAVNSQGTAILLERIASAKGGKVRRFILASSRSIYGEGAYRCQCSDQLVYPAPRTAEALAAGHWDHICETCGASLEIAATPETAPIRPASVYAATKAAQEELVRVVAPASSVDSVIFRFQNVYGEGQSLNNPYTGILSVFSTRIRRGTFLPIFEDGAETRDFVHVSDIVGALIAGLRHPEPLNDVFNVGSGVATSVETIARELTYALGREPDIRITGEYRLGDIRHNRADISKLVNTLGYRPSVDIVDGLARFAGWTLDQPLPVDRLDAANEELRARKLMN